MKSVFEIKFEYVWGVVASIDLESEKLIWSREES